MQEITFIIQTLALAVVLTAVVLTGVGELLGARLPLLRKVALPGAVLGGLLDLGLSAVELPATKDVFKVLGEFPVLFACLLLGKRVDGIFQGLETGPTSRHHRSHNSLGAVRILK